jgi:hypothetical protein
MGHDQFIKGGNISPPFGLWPGGPLAERASGPEGKGGGEGFKKIISNS